MFLNGVEMFFRKPLFGYGTNGFANYGSMNNGWSHNTFSEILCDYGLVGFIFFFFPVINCVCSIFKHVDKKNLMAEILVLVVFIISMFSVSVDTEKIYSFSIGLVFGAICETSYSIEFPVVKRIKK